MFYFDVNPCVCESPEGSVYTAEDFYYAAQGDVVAMENVIEARKKVKVGSASVADLRKNLRPVITTSPALHVEQIGQDGKMKERVVVRKQEMVVSWGSREKMKAFMKGERNLFHRLLFGERRLSDISTGSSSSSNSTRASSAPVNSS